MHLSTARRRVLAGVGVCVLVLVALALPSHAGIVIDVSITKTDGAVTATAGTTVTYTIVASNSGPSPAQAIVTDNFSAMFTAVSWTCSGTNATCEAASGTGNLAETDNIAANGFVTYTVMATLNCEATGTLSNTATVTALGDFTPANNAAVDTDTIIPAACPPGGEPGVSTIVVDKVVEGTQPEGTQFTISLDCVFENDPPDPQEAVIDGPGNVFTTAVSTTIAGKTCTVAEPEDGGATSVAFSCDATGDAVCEADNRVEFPDQSEDEGTITVTNSFVEPTPIPEPTLEPGVAPAAAAIETGPGFTG